MASSGLEHSSALCCLIWLKARTVVVRRSLMRFHFSCNRDCDVVTLSGKMIHVIHVFIFLSVNSFITPLGQLQPRPQLYQLVDHRFPQLDYPPSTSTTILTSTTTSDANARNQQGDTALDLAKARRYKKIVRLLQQYT